MAVQFAHLSSGGHGNPAPPLLDGLEDECVEASEQECEKESPFEDPSADGDSDEWETIFWRDVVDVPISTHHPVATPAPQPPNQLPAGSWATPKSDNALVAPGTRIQRRMPKRCFQVHIKAGDLQYSKAFTWAADGSPTMDEQLSRAVEWSWEQFEKSQN